MAGTIHAAASLRHTDRDPVGGAITDTPIACWIHQGFQQHGFDPVVRQPVAGQLLRGAGQDMASEVRNPGDRKSTRLNSSHANISYAVFCLKKKKHGSNLLSARSIYDAS